MPNLIHIVETALLLLVAYQGGWFVGFAARRLRLPKRAETAAVALAVVPADAAVKEPTLEPAIAAALAETVAAETAERAAAEMAALSAPPPQGRLPEDFLQDLEVAMASPRDVAPTGSDETSEPAQIAAVVVATPQSISPMRPMAAPEPTVPLPLPGFAELLADAVPLRPLVTEELEPGDLAPAIVMASVVPAEPVAPTIVDATGIAGTVPSVEKIVPSVERLPPFLARPAAARAEPQPEPPSAEPVVIEATARPADPPAAPPFVLIAAPTLVVDAQPEQAEPALPPVATPGPIPNVTTRTRPDLRPASRAGELWSKQGVEGPAQMPTSPMPAAPAASRPQGEVSDEDAEATAMRAIEGGWNVRKPVRKPIKDLPEGVDR